MVADSILLHAENGQNDHREDASLFIAQTYTCGEIPMRQAPEDVDRPCRSDFFKFLVQKDENEGLKDQERQGRRNLCFSFMVLEIEKLTFQDLN